ncbi:MAG: DUF1688 family protein [Leptolyngbya sp. DLM2.Bin15]|nr:MAG: DUF1688 family protein [Leptolyngbya sp. DLM2.Bin15]
MATEADTLAYLRSTAAIRDRCGQLFDLACADQLSHFRCDLTRLTATADYVIQVIEANYPDWAVPFHSRWRHFESGDRDRLAHLSQQVGTIDPLEWARIQFDLAITSVLLDAGAGATWQFTEPGTDEVYQRSEGLAIASFYAFTAGTMSSDAQQPLQADAQGLQQFTPDRLAAAFQVSDRNPLVGLEGRAGLLQTLGRSLHRYPHLFGQERPRLGNLVDALLPQVVDQRLPATAVFDVVLEGLSDIWPGRVAIAQVNLGDVWPHPRLPDGGLGSQLVPFHKLSQWLTYSLLEPLQSLGITITDLDALTGLAEYRNGGLCVDLGLLQPKHAGVVSDRHLPGSEVIVEWRALTVVLLDQIAATIRQTRQQDATQLPLVKILEGGTWAAGRRIAAELRDGSPPLQIQSDGTVF